VLRRILFSIARACGERFFEIKVPQIDLRTLALGGLGGPLCSLGLNPAFDLLVLRDRQRSQWRSTASDPRRVVGLQLGSVLTHVVDDHIKLLVCVWAHSGRIRLKQIAEKIARKQGAARRNIPRLNLIGWSWGAVTMAKYSPQNPSKVERLILYAPGWIRQTASLVQAGPGPLGAYRKVTREQAMQRWMTGVPDDKK